MDKMNMNDGKVINMDAAAKERKEAFQILSTSEKLFVLLSPCTRLPFVQCDPETFDDQIFIYENEEDLKREGQRFLKEKQPVHPAKIENKQFLSFYATLYTMGVNCIVLNGFTDKEYRMQLADLVKRPGTDMPDGRPWVENTALHLTALYFMQELRREKREALTEELQEMQNEILANFKKGTYLMVFKEGNQVPLLKLPNGDAYQPLFTDIFELQKFGREKDLRVTAISAEKVVAVLSEEAKGVIINPMGVNLQLPIVRKPKNEQE